MAKIIDRRNKSMGGNDKRLVSNITGIAIHYSATAQGHTASFENHWKNARGWNTGGYHEVVLLNGDVELNYNADTISNGVYGHNSKIYNICYVGDGKPNEKQLKTLKERANYNRKRFGLSANAVKGHREFSGQSTSCPGLGMGEFRKSLTGAASSNQTATDHTKEKKSKWVPVSGNWTEQTLKKWDYGKPVKQLQKLLGVKDDGYFGSDTESAVKIAQKSAKIAIDGLAGKDTYKALNDTPKSNMTVDGKWGTDVTKGLQRYFKTPVDGKLSGQLQNVVTSALYSNTAAFGSGGSVVVRALQKFLGEKVDGLLGPATIRALQSYLGTPVDGRLSKVSPMVKELQRRLNAGTF